MKMRKLYASGLALVMAFTMAACGGNAGSNTSADFSEEVAPNYLGTFIPTFISIPAVGTSITFLIFAGILLVLSTIYFVGSKVIPKKIPIAMLIFLFCCIWGHSNSFAFWQNNLTYENESIYNYLQIGRAHV